MQDHKHTNMITVHDIHTKLLYNCVIVKGLFTMVLLVLKHNLLARVQYFDLPPLQALSNVAAE